MNKHDLARKVSDLLITKEDDSYHLFGQYVITKTGELYSVTYLPDTEISNLLFAQLKHAVTWCVFHKNKKHRDLNKILELDEALDGLQVTINNLKRLVLKADYESKNIYLAKLYEDKVKRQQAQKAMNVYVDTSKYWQNKVFKDSQTI
jgi:hypothetical protein